MSRRWLCYPLLFLCHTGAYAQGDPFGDESEGLGKGGFSGELGLLVGYGEGVDEDRSVKSGPLNSKADTKSAAIVMPLGQLRYTLGEHNDEQFFFGMSPGDLVEGVVALELGYAFQYGQGSSLAFSYLPTVVKGEVWADPFIVGEARKKTDVSGNAFRMQAENLFDIGLSAELAYYDQNVVDERSGMHQGGDTELLSRDATGYYVSVSQEVPLSERQMLGVSLDYRVHDADGKAQAFDSYGASLMYMAMVGQHRLSLNIEYSKRDYDAQNPVFSLTRDDSEYGATLVYGYDKIMGWEDWSFNAVAGYSNLDSNINFYDVSDYLFGVGLSYHF
ncbi:DUF2860 domain-containing protein [Ferrimonas aestuarii]|uniref:DUF2860 domain-containing protein n=1 Tax=Ferrimonas aestuarii TaxID=2569539 RepID=A0A4U1BGT8_9GAMM|nr:DUF2860 domain-containing protein [Ferrimonas aestuarii]TKB49678.1 DUF2860 domain-containing protein [Ferrimonas aestuarii]